MGEEVTAREGPCSADHWHQLLVAMNAKGEQTEILKQAFEGVAHCHQHHGGRLPYGVIVKPYRKYYLVNRQELFKFVQEHGKICGKEKQ